MAKSPTLSGEIGLLSPFDLGQLFLLNGATGELCLQRDGRRGYLYFDRGQIVNAVDDEYHEGDGAAYQLFTWKTGTFEFRPEPPTGARAVTGSTESLMLEAARRMDELGLGEAGETAKLKQRASVLDALREAFQSVARETGSDGSAGDVALGSPFGRLQDASDALLLRPGRRPRARRAGTWADTGDAPIDPGTYEQLRARLHEPAGKDVARVCMTTGDEGRRYVTARLTGESEALWVRLADLPAPSLASLPGGDALSTMLLGATGLLVVGGPDGDKADRLFHACVAHLVATRGAAVLLVSEGGRWHLADGTGALLHAGGHDAEAVLRACGPGIAAYDAAHAGASAAALGVTPLVVACVVAGAAEALLPGWCSRTGRRWGDGIETVLEGFGAFVAFAPAEPSIPLLASRLEFGAAQPVFTPPKRRAA